MFASCPGLSEQAGEQRNENDADQGDTAARHELLHALTFRAGVVVAVAFQQVDGSPDAKSGTQSDDEGLEDPNSRVEKFHTMIFAADKRLSGHRVRQQFSFQNIVDLKGGLLCRNQRNLYKNRPVQAVVSSPERSMSKTL